MMCEKLKTIDTIFNDKRGCPSKVKGGGLKTLSVGEISAGVGLRGFKSHPPHQLFIKTLGNSFTVTSFPTLSPVSTSM